MLIDKDLCHGCKECIPYCPVDAIIYRDEGYSEIDLDRCAECSACKRANVCPNDAIYQQPLQWPRTVRSILSDVLTVCVESGISGRGTEEMKTNDVTGRFKRGYAGMAIELGRPVVGARFYDVEKVAMAVAALGGIEFEKQNPTTSLMSDPKTGKFKDDLLNEFVLSAIIEFPVKLERVPAVLDALNKVAGQIDSVFSLDICTRVASDNSLPTEQVVKQAGYWISPNGKTNVGLGRPRKEDN
jgi:NAD-dependent dihydropyrimidine dehydrogenase PreA subunit